jgi:hypothetical protein
VIPLAFVNVIAAAPPLPEGEFAEPPVDWIVPLSINIGPPPAFSVTVAAPPAPPPEPLGPPLA